MNSSKSSLANDILAGKATGQLSKAISLNDFKNLYRQVHSVAQEKKQNLPDVEILLLSDSAIVRFTSAKNFIIRINEGRSLFKNDFELVISPKFYGNVQPIPLRGFIWTELRKNGLILTVLFIGFTVLFGFDSNNLNLQVLSQMLVEANALFIGIFVLFTITQNRDLLATRELIKQGITHRMMRNDFYITALSISSLLAAFLTVALIETPLNFTLWTIKATSWQIEITTARIAGSFALILLIDCLLSVTQYYLQLMRAAVEGTMFRAIMGSKKDEDLL